MYLTRFNPYNVALRKTANKDFFNNIFYNFFNDEDDYKLTSNKSSFVPAVDIKETDDSYVVVTDLPGVSKEDIKIETHDNRLKLSGEKKSQDKKEEDNVLHFERSHGSFERTWVLPTDVDSENISAEMKEGVLILKLPKVEEVKPKEITVN